jgi:hypothetical protein
MNAAVVVGRKFLGGYQKPHLEFFTRIEHSEPPDSCESMNLQSLVS